MVLIVKYLIQKMYGWFEYSCVFFFLFLIPRVRTFTYIIRDDEGQKRGAPAPAIGDEDWRAVLNTR